MIARYLLTRMSIDSKPLAKVQYCYMCLENDIMRIYTSGPSGPLVLRYLCRYIETMAYPRAVDRLDLTGH